MIDLHTHTTYSDGELIPAELLRRAQIKGCAALAITDHVDPTNIRHTLDDMEKIKTLKEHYTPQIIIGVELTHIPPPAIAQIAADARNMGAEIIIVHGETPVEPVAEKTNLAALKSDIDILAHPGFITSDEAKLAADNNIYLELTSRSGHNRTNGHVARMAEEYDAKLIVNTDTHAPYDLITHEEAMKIAMGAGLTRRKAEECMKNSKELVSTL